MKRSEWEAWANAPQVADAREIVERLGFDVRPVGDKRVVAHVYLGEQRIRQITDLGELATWSGGLRDALLALAMKKGGDDGR